MIADPQAKAFLAKIQGDGRSTEHLTEEFEEFWVTACTHTCRTKLTELWRNISKRMARVLTLTCKHGR